ncbi:MULTISPECIES: hypothetical protein [unclassified Akkermansia]|nr:MULTISPECIES: hypothetical protein [unclassified Akkermansia]MEE0765047.1 hypothetical protein [Akkermansia sp.]
MRANKAASRAIRNGSVSPPRFEKLQPSVAGTATEKHFHGRRKCAA